MNELGFSGQRMVIGEKRVFPGEEITQAKYQVMKVVN